MNLYVDKKEMLRYWGIKVEPNELESEIADKAGALALGAAQPKIIHETFDCEICGDDVKIGVFHAKSQKLANCLKNSKSAILLCATMGIEIDKLIAKYSKINPALSLAISAAGSALIETYLDEFTAELKAQKAKDGLILTHRFSPGFADLSLDYQTDFFDILQITRRIGVVLNDSLLMTPTKSVTAIIGFRKDEP
ncbi:MAG: hypothetical protein UH824_08145 [Acutalibacteraceae bacterium]|nr:hypothetical protein [Acutalibacteraceae bacterium]